MTKYAEQLKVLPVLAPVAFTTSPVASPFVNMAQVNWLSFVVSFGLMTSDSTDTVTLTVEACPIGSTTDSNETAMKFDYRLSSAVGNDAWGSITSATATGMSVNAADDDSKVVKIEVDPIWAAKAVAGGKYVRLVATPSAEMASGVISAVAIIEPRYPANAIPSST